MNSILPNFPDTVKYKLSSWQGQKRDDTKSDQCEPELDSRLHDQARKSVRGAAECRLGQSQHVRL